jgi:hypothetical protein
MGGLLLGPAQLRPPRTNLAPNGTKDLLRLRCPHAWEHRPPPPNQPRQNCRDQFSLNAMTARASMLPSKTKLWFALLAAIVLSAACAHGDSSPASAFTGTWKTNGLPQAAFPVTLTFASDGKVTGVWEGDFKRPSIPRHVRNSRRQSASPHVAESGRRFLVRAQRRSPDLDAGSHGHRRRLYVCATLD